MASDKERLASLEAKADQAERERGKLWERADAIPALQAELAGVRAELQRLTERLRWAARLALWVGCTVGLEFASGAWARVFSGLARQLARGLG